MVRLWLVLGVVVAVFYIYSIVDCALSDGSRARGLPKAAWVPIIVVFPVIGGALWFVVGRPRKEVELPHTTAPDDDPDFLRNLERQRAQQERIRRLEQELADLDHDQAGQAKPGSQATSQPSEREKPQPSKRANPQPNNAKPQAKNNGDDPTGRRDA